VIKECRQKVKCEWETGKKKRKKLLTKMWQSEEEKSKMCMRNRKKA
jgi:hypothetical protein